MVTRTARRIPRRRPAGRPRYALARPGMVSGRFLARRRIARRFPTFTETLIRPTPVLSNSGGILNFSVDMLPQLAQYQALYRQYKVNWVKFTLVPDYNTASADFNAATYNAQTPGLAWTGMARIAWAVNTTPGIAAPATELALLEDNGAKIRGIGSKWSASCKPVPDQTLGGATNVYMRRSYAPWLSFAESGANPVHNGISYFLSQNSNNLTFSYQVYIKVNFSLRDPQ